MGPLEQERESVLFCGMGVCERQICFVSLVYVLSELLIVGTS